MRIISIAHTNWRMAALLPFAPLAKPLYFGLSIRRLMGV
jgi:hypothetical protein